MMEMSSLGPLPPPPLEKLMEFSNKKILCKCCTEDIISNGNLIVQCMECPDKLELCLECFAGGAELGLHKCTHSYRLLDNAGYPVLSSKSGSTSWTGAQHIKLMDAIEQYGYGNWQDIAKTFKNKTPEETKQEFCSTFISGPIGRVSWKEESRGRTRDHTQSNPLLPTPNNEPPPNLTLHETIMLGYMPKRDDFEVEHDNLAESLVSTLQGGMTANPDEDELEVALKIAHVDMYKWKLRERERRKRVSREHDLISQFFKDNPVGSEGGNKKDKNGSLIKNRKSKNGNDVMDKLKILAEFQGAKEHQAFINSMNRERELKQRIKDHLKYRKNGVIKFSDATEFDVQKSRLNRRRQELRKKNGDSELGIKSEDYFGNGASPYSPATAIKEESKVLSFSELPSYEILSANEKKLCTNLKLTPAQYISYKTSLLTNHLQKKKGQTPKPLNPIGLDKINRKIIFNFLMRAGWINAY